MPLNTDFYTREEMGRRGWMWGKVEHYNHATGKKNDLWGLFDFLAMCPKEQLCVGIQSTTRDGLKKHQNKMEGEGRDALNLWLSCGNAVLLWGWYIGTNGKVAPGGRRRSNVYKKPPGDWHGNKTVFLWEEELVLREVYNAD